MTAAEHAGNEGNTQGLLPHVAPCVNGMLSSFMHRPDSMAWSGFLRGACASQGPSMSNEGVRVKHALVQEHT